MYDTVDRRARIANRLAGKAIERLEKSPIDSVVITDSIPLRPEHRLDKIKVLSVATLLGEAIKRIHHDQSISAIFSESEAVSD